MNRTLHTAARYAARWARTGTGTERLTKAMLVLVTGSAVAVWALDALTRWWWALALAGAAGWALTRSSWGQTVRARFTRPTTPTADPGQWTGERALVRAFTDAGLLRPPGPDDPPHRLPLAAPPTRDSHGTTVTVTLPTGLLFTAVTARRESLAAALGEPVKLLTITQRDDEPANRATIRVATPHVRTERVHTLPPVTSWRDPLTVGRDRRGRDVTVPTYDTGQVLVGGRTGSGKTHFLRLLAAHYALDPTARVYLADGKGSTDDWGPLTARCDRLLFIHDEDPAAAFTALLSDVQTLVTDRLRAGGRDHPGVLVILEEFTALLASLDPGPKRDAERAVTRITQTCRAANVLVVIAAQRPSASSMDTNTRAQASVSVALAMKSPTDAAMILGHTPTLELPSLPGEAILVTPGSDDVAVDLDTLPDGPWAALCSRLPARDAAPARQPAPARRSPTPPPTPTRAVYVPTRPGTARPGTPTPPAPAPGLRLVTDPPTDDPAGPGTARDTVLTALTAAAADTGTARTAQVLAATGLPRSTVAWALAELTTAGLVVKVGRGEYGLPGTDAAMSN